MLKTKKVPTLIGLVVIVVGLAASLFLVKRSQVLFLRAKEGTIPGQIKVTNITDNSFTVSWFTSELAEGSVRSGTKPGAIDIQNLDERDLNSGEKESHFSHYVSLNNLNPGTVYYFEIYSDSYKYDDNGKPYQITTAPEAKSKESASDLSYGSVFGIDGGPAEGAIVYFNVGDSTLQSSLVTSAGNWAVSLSQARTLDLSDFVTYSPDETIIEIFVQDRQQTATVVTTTGQDDPVPPITLGENLNFLDDVSEEDKEAQSLPSGFAFDEASLATPSSSLLIFNPEDGEEIFTQRPEFMGKAPANKEIEIEVRSPIFTDKITVGEWGDWQWSPPEDLDPGEHTITISFVDDSGEKKILSQLFVVLAAEEGELPSFTATPSATPTTVPSPAPTLIPTTALTPSPSPSPTITPVPTASPTPTLSATPTASPAPVATTSSGADITAGVVTPTIIVFIFGIVLAGIGVLMQVLKI